ncbi:MAG: heavy-metal-associated domain-containing protein [Fimbriimonadales bacterium]|nr:heavy-metal-associated domain-containing protein [Fimbriimonadales bacterium]MCS7190421.1 heavy-metal-associated domain-containing protein [Fimbriimonadales bacterium]
MNLQEKVWQVPDIECEGCVRSIHRALDDVDGVQQVEVDLLQKTVRVLFDSDRVQAEQIHLLIEQAGFSPR